ncbi:MAG: hypothetical protein H0U44_04635 [Flavisolibacter sp.]|jgi:hypothetical protein|nr:hypothetical protein [Flavisolibacter sp.]
MAIFFSKVIKAGERQREFNFRKLSQSNDLNFQVDVPDDKGNRVNFQMSRNEEGKWITSTPSLPVWIQHVEEILNEAIIEQTKEPERRK